MGDHVADLPPESEIPPLPLKTYQWEDIRRQKLEGRYPWTHLYKEPFDDKKWEEAKEHEYEPVIPMDIHKITPPLVKITPDREYPLPAPCPNIEPRKPNQDKNHLLVPPPGNDYDDAENDDDSDSDDPSEEITAEELQHRLEEKYFRTPSPASSSFTTSTKHEYELTETRSVSPALTDDRASSSHSNAGDTPKLPHKVQSQADKLRRRFKSFKDQISKEYTDCSPKVKRKASLDEPVPDTQVKQSKAKVRRQPKKNKFNFRRHGAKKSAAPPKLPSEPDLHDSDEQPSPQSSFRRFSFRSLRSLRRSPSTSSIKEQRKRSLSSESPASKKKFDFHFGTYPRGIFGKRSKKVDESAEATPDASKPKSAPGTPLPRRSAFSQKWMSKLTIERKKKPKELLETSTSATTDNPADAVIKETIFISLHKDGAKKPEAPAEPATPKRPNSPPGLPPTPPETAPATKIDIDNKNFFFISLHEERFPEKLQKGDSQSAEFSQEEQEMEREIKKAQTARKFHHMLRKLETDRNLKARRRVENDDKPEPVVITEIPADDEDDSFRGTEDIANCVQTPEEENVVFERCPAEDVPPEKLSFEEAAESAKSETSKLLDFGKKVGWDKLKFGRKSASVEKDVKCTSKESEETKPVNRERPRVDPTVLLTPPESPAQINPAESPPDSHCEVDVQIQCEFIPTNVVPRKMPRKKPKAQDSGTESKESLSAFEDSTFADAIVLDERKSFTKTYIQASLDEIPVSVEPLEPEQTAKQFKEYETALEKSRTYRSIELRNNFYSTQNTLARLETPMPPSRPNRKGTLTRAKREKSTEQTQENEYDLEAPQNFNTFPMMKPDKPRRRLKRRTYSNSTNTTENTEMKNIHELEDDAINQNIVNSKQLSISFLPLTSNIVGEPITDYNLRETSSMIHLNFDPPLPPKRRKGPIRNDASHKYNTLPSRRYVSKTSSSPSEAYHLDLNIDGEIEYADDVNSTVPDSDTPPKRPTRQRSTGPSTVDEDRTSRGIESISSEQSSKSMDFDDPKDVHGYAIIGKPAAPRPSQTQSDGRNSQGEAPRHKSRRFSDFFTFPRIRVPTNYVPTSTQTLDRRRLPSPSRPPRRGRPFREPTYTNDDLPQAAQDCHKMTFDGEEQLNFNLATEDSIFLDHNEDSKNLQTEDILEKMKARPLPPPPRPTRKPRDEGKSEHYSQSTKKKRVATNDLGESECTFEEKIINTTFTATAGGQRTETESKNWLTNECSNSSTRFEQLQESQTRVSGLILEHEARAESSTRDARLTYWNSSQPSQDTKTEPEKRDNINPLGGGGITDKIDQNLLTSNSQSTVHTDQTSQYPPERPSAQNLPVNPSGAFNSISTAKLEISELNVARLNVGEIESSRLLTSTIDSSRLQVSNIQSETGSLLLNNVEFAQSQTSACPIGLESGSTVDQREITPSSDDAASTDLQPGKQRPRISSMITEVGSDDEPNSKVAKVVRPNRRKQSLKRLSEASCSYSSTDGDRPTLTELMCQILQICHSSVGQAIHSLLEQIIPEDREKRNEVQAAIWVMTIIVAGCLMLGLQSNEKIVHHHHWDFHFPPPH